MTNSEAQLKNFLLYVHKCFREDYDIQMNKNYTSDATLQHPLEGQTTEERLANVYNRIRLNTEKLQDLLDDLDKRLGKKKKGDK